MRWSGSPVCAPASRVQPDRRGVHALRFCCALDTGQPSEGGEDGPALNACLPLDIAVTGCREVAPDFHPRYMAAGKRYRYQIWNAPARNPFYAGYALHRAARLDEEEMNRTASLFIGTHDFSAFCASGSGVEDHVRTVRLAQVDREGDLLRFRVEADGFLYHMVRIMAGSLLDVQAGRLRESHILEALRTGDRSLAGFTGAAPRLVFRGSLLSGGGTRMAKKQDLKITRRKPKAGRDPGDKGAPPRAGGSAPAFGTGAGTGSPAGKKAEAPAPGSPGDRPPAAGGGQF